MTDTQRKRSVLLFSPFFFPENISTGRYNSHLALALSRAGADVVAVCSYPFYPEWEVRTEEIGELEDIQCLRGGRGVRYPRSQVIRRFVLEFWYFFFARKTTQSLSGRQFDLVIDIYPPNLFSLDLSRKRKLAAPIVGIVHDLQGVMSQTKSSFFRQIIGKLIRPLERKALQRCDRLIFLSNAMMQFALDNYGLDREKCDVAYPFQSLSEKDGGKIPPALLAHKRTLVYSGALGEKQAPDDLLQLMDLFARRHDDYGVLVFSNGPIFDSLKEQYATAGSPVEFHGLVPDDELEGMLRSSTIQIIPQKLSVSHGAFPSKLPNLIAIGTPVFAITDRGSEVDHILSRYSLGETTYDWDVATTIRALEDFAHDLESGVEGSGGGIDDGELVDLFTIEKLCEKIWAVTEAAE
jgi:putative colanic acid biosynthesis glycosyltransferase WcaI